MWPSRLSVADLILPLAIVGIGLRLNNVLYYPVSYGYDEVQNWRYVELLLDSWNLPAPDADWSTAHPPLFYALSAGLARLLGRPEPTFAISVARLLNAGVGLVMVLLAVRLVRRVEPANGRRAAIAAALLLFLPAHLTMSAMFTEEILVSAFISLALYLVATDLMRDPAQRGGRRSVAAGLAGGLAALTKLTGWLIVGATASAQAIDGWRRGGARGGLLSMATVLAVALAVGGWFYARNWIQYGYFYPHNLPLHAKMLSMPPGERRPGDYVRVPLATFTDPQALSPDLLRSVWGTTYASTWFDAHRHFLPRSNPRVNLAGTLILVLALLPTAAFAIGLARGVRRVVRAPGGPDLPLLLAVFWILAGYVAFTWRNPQFAVLKGSYLLGLSLPFSFYASEVLARWTAGRGLRARAAWIGLFALVACVAVAFKLENGLWSLDEVEFPGMRWVPIR